MPNQYWSAVWNNPIPIADGSALANSTSLTDVSPAPQFAIPANSLQVGSVIRVSCDLEFSTTSTPTLLVGVYYGGAAGTALCDTGAVTTPSGASHAICSLVGRLVCRAIGSSGTIMAIGQVQNLTAGGVSPMGSAGATTPATVTVDTTSDKTLTVAAQWGTASASNTLTVHTYVVELLN